MFLNFVEGMMEYIGYGMDLVRFAFVKRFVKLSQRWVVDVILEKNLASLG